MDIDGISRGAMEEQLQPGQMPAWLAQRAATDADVEALRYNGASLSYRELYRLATQIASELRRDGVKDRSRVAVLVRNGRLFALAVHSLMQMGILMVPLNWRLTISEMTWQVRDSEVDFLIYDGESEREAQEISTETQVRVWKIEDLLDEDKGLGVGVANRRVEANSNQLIEFQRPLAVIYTSGTTGHPKGTILTYGNFWWSAIASALQSGLQKNDKWLVPMPLFHVGGLSVLMRSVIYGITAVIQDRFDAVQVNRTLDEEEITLLSVVPTMLARMLEERRGAAYPGRLRLVLLGGSSAPRRVLEDCSRLGVPVAQSYGLTEACSQVATLLPEDGLRKLGSSGMPLFPTQIRILEGEQTLEANEIGEIAVRSPTVTPGYLNRPQDNALSFRNGWFMTGDIGYLDEEGYLFVIDRRNDLIVSGGENVYPAEVEAVLLRHPGVLEAGVVGAEHSLWGQVPMAVIRLPDGTSILDAELEEHCRQYLAGYKVPKTFLRMDSPLPRNASGKLLRRDLRVRVNELWNKE